MTMFRSLVLLKNIVFLTALASLMTACNGSDNDGNNAEDNPFSEVAAQGATRYLDVFTPMLSETDAVDSRVLNHSFGSSGNGPMCITGTEYTMSTRDMGSEDLVIYLRGGGACWEDFPSCTQTASGGIPMAGVLDSDLPNNPIAGWNIAHFPYCDGGTHASDVDYPEPNAFYPEGRFHHGLQNLSAGLGVTVRAFPNPRRIVLAGESGGGYGTIFALPLVRALYPGVPIDLINDSGVAVGKPDEPEFFLDRLDYWNISDSFLPASCADCIADDGHGTGIHIYALDNDPDLRLSLLSFTQDGTIAGFFFEVPGPVWQQALIEEMAELEAAHPERTRSFIAPGTDHTFLLNKTDLAIEGITVLEWVTAMLDGSDEWESVQEL